MTTLQLHPLPILRVVVEEQFRAVLLVARKFLVLLGMLLVIADAVVVYSLIAARQLASRGLPNQGVAILPGFHPGESFIVAIVAMMFAILIWIDEDVSRRDYHWTLPVSRSRHALTKVFVGWVLVMATTLVALADLSIMHAVSVTMQKLQGMNSLDLPAWTYLVPFTTATVAYLFASAACVSARRPIVWIMGVPALYVGFVMTFSFASAATKKSVIRLWTAEYGLASLLGEVVQRTFDASGWRTEFVVGRWLGSVALWGSVSLALLLFLAARRRGRVAGWRFALLNWWASRYVPAAQR